MLSNFSASSTVPDSCAFLNVTSMTIHPLILPILCLTCGMSDRSSSTAIASVLSSTSLDRERTMLDSASMLANLSCGASRDANVLLVRTEMMEKMQCKSDNQLNAAW